MKLLALLVIWIMSLVALRAQAKSGCTKVWVDDDAIFESRSMAKTIKFERKTKTLTWQNDRETQKSKRLDAKAFAKLDDVLAKLCLTKIENEPAPPPGGPADIKITDKSGQKRLGWKGNTGGSYYLLTPKDLKTLFDLLNDETRRDP